MKLFRYNITRICLPLLVMASAALFTSCGDDDDNLSAPVPEATGTWTDTRDGSQYTWVRYGNQEWTTSNLHYQPAAGTVQPDLTPVLDGMYDDGVAAKYYAAFGFLYDYEAAEAAIPDGWRLPTDDDWQTLARNTNGDIAGAIGLSLSGYYLANEYFQQIHDISYYTYIYGFYWTATTDTSKTEENFAYYRKIYYNRHGSDRESMTKNNFLSVRLVRDAQ